MEAFFDFAKNGPMFVGIVVALITWFMITKFKTFDPKTLVAVLGALFAGVVVSFVMKGTSPDAVADALGRYSFGLLVGTAAYYAVYRLSQGKWPTVVTQ